MKRCGRGALGGFALAGLVWSAAALAAPADYYKGKEFDVYIGSTPGGGYDQYGRLLARHIDAHIPGVGSVVPKNMPAGGGRAVMNYVYSVAPKDGTAIAITLRNVPFDPLMGNPETKIDAAKVTWIGSMNAETSLCVSWHTSPFHTIDDVRKREMLVGSSGPSAADSTHVKLLNAVAGTKMKIVLGYKGSTEVHLAMERGEVQGRCGFGWDSIVSRYKKWLDDKDIYLLVQFAIEKHPDLPNVPFIMDLARTEADKQLAVLMLAPNKMGRPIFGPPGIPAERVTFLRRAFDATMKDPALVEDAKKMRVDIVAMTGEEVEALVKRLYATPKPVVEKARAILESN
jgi:tripartite-type tricarboxylate transporter receptor subunit TctC